MNLREQIEHEAAAVARTRQEEKAGLLRCLVAELIPSGGVLRDAADADEPRIILQCGIAMGLHDKSVHDAAPAYVLKAEPWCEECAHKEFSKGDGTFGAVSLLAPDRLADLAELLKPIDGHQRSKHGPPLITWPPEKAGQVADEATETESDHGLGPLCENCRHQHDPEDECFMCNECGHFWHGGVACKAADCQTPACQLPF